MGLKKLVFTSITSTLHDKWEEYITSDDLETSNLILKKVIKNGLSGKVRIEVKEGEIALICDASRIIDATDLPGIYSFDSTSDPFIYDLQFESKYREMFDKIKNNSIEMKDQAVFFINTKEITNNKFGVATPVLYEDLEHGDVYLRYYGEYTYKINDPFEFFINNFNNKDIYYQKDFETKINSIFIEALSRSLQMCANEGVSYLDLPNKSLLIAKHINEILLSSDINVDGILISEVKIINISPFKKVNTNNQNEPKKENFVRDTCPNCGAKIIGKFCSECGIKLE